MVYSLLLGIAPFGDRYSFLICPGQIMLTWSVVRMGLDTIEMSLCEESRDVSNYEFLFGYYFSRNAWGYLFVIFMFLFSLYFEGFESIRMLKRRSGISLKNKDVHE